MGLRPRHCHKANESRQTRCLKRSSKYWGERYKERFAILRYLRSSKTFFKRIITIVKMALSLQGWAGAFRKLNNLIYSRLNQPRPNVVTDKWRHDSSYDWEYLAQNFDDISDDPIAENDLLRLKLHEWPNTNNEKLFQPKGASIAEQFISEHTCHRRTSLLGQTSHPVLGLELFTQDYKLPFFPIRVNQSIAREGEIWSQPLIF